MPMIARRSFLMGGASALALSRAQARMMFDPATDQFRVPRIHGAPVQTGQFLIAPLNRQAVDGMTVETWRGRHLSMIAAPGIPGAVITVSDPEGRFTVQGKPGEPHLLQQWGLNVGPIGTVYSLTFTATNGARTLTQVLSYTVKPFSIDPDRYLAFWDYTDPATLTLDGNGRVIKAVDKLHGCIREHAGGYANTAPGSNAPVFNAATKRMRLTRASSQYLKLAPDAVNDPIRALTGPINFTGSHIVFYIPTSATADGQLVGYQDANGYTKTMLSGGPTAANAKAGAGVSRGGAGRYPASGAGMGVEMPDAVALNDLHVAHFAANAGGKIWVGLDDRRPSGPGIAPGDNNYATSTIVACDLGRAGADLGRYFDGIVVAEIIGTDDVCPSEIRGIWETLRTQKPEQGFRALGEWRQPIDLSKIDAPRFDTAKTGWGHTTTLAQNYERPGMFSRQLGNAVFDIPANETEPVAHLAIIYPEAASLITKLQEELVGNRLALRGIPLATSGLSAATQNWIKANKPGVAVTHLGSYRTTRNWQTMTSGMSEVVCLNAPSVPGNFSCALWDLHDGGGHPPETDVFEQTGANEGISCGLHQNARHPWAGTRQSGASTNGGNLARSALGKEYHSYQCVRDAESDTWGYYQDGYLHSLGAPIRGVRLDSMRAWKYALQTNTPAGVGGSGIKAGNGTANGQLRVSFVNAGGGSQNNFTVLVQDGVIVDFYWDLEVAGQSPYSSTSMTAGLYNTNDPFYLTIAGTSTPITATTQPDCSLVQVGMNDPVFPEGYHVPLYMISNMTFGAFTGTPKADQTAELILSNMRIHPMRRSPANVTSAIQAAADAHCTDLFAALAAKGGANPDTTDRNILANLVVKAMGTERRWDREMDGGDMMWDRINARSIWKGIAQLGLFVGPYNGLIDFRDPANLFTSVGAPSRSVSGGFAFAGVAGQFIDGNKSLAGDAAVANLFRDDDSAFSVILTGDAMAAGAPFRPICGAGATVRLDLSGPGVTRSITVADVSGSTVQPLQDRFTVRHGINAPPVDALARTAMGPGFYSVARHEQRFAVWRNGDLSAPFYSSYYAGRNQAIQHTGGIAPNETFKIGSYASTVQGAAASVGGFVVSRWWGDEEHAAFYGLLKPLLQRYGVPGH